MGDRWENTLPHYTDPGRINTEITWHGYLGVDNLDGIVERITRIVAPGRTVILTHSDSSRRPTVKAGLTLDENSAGYRPAIAQRTSEDRGCGFSVQLSPGIASFSAWGGSSYDFNREPNSKSMTGLEVKRAAEAEGGRRFDWSWIEITGGLPSHGLNRTLELITIIRQNEHGYRETIQIIPGDMCWQQRHERDALTAEKLAAALRTPGSEISEYHPAHDLAGEDRDIAAGVLLHMAANLRKWREPLTRDETYPAIDGRWL